MVAETAPSLPAKPRKKPAFHPGNPIPVAVKLTIRSCYILQGLQPSQIAPLVSLTTVQVANLVRREGWSKLRAEKREQKETRAISRQDAHAEEQISRIHEAAAIRTEECMIKTADHCAAVLDSDTIDGKELQMASGSLRNFVQSARMLRGMDRGAQNSPGANGQGNSATVIFVGELPRAQPKLVQPVQAQPAIDVSANTVPPANPA